MSVTDGIGQTPCSFEHYLVEYNAVQSDVMRCFCFCVDLIFIAEIRKMRTSSRDIFRTVHHRHRYFIRNKDSVIM